MDNDIENEKHQKIIDDAIEKAKTDPVNVISSGALNNMDILNDIQIMLTIEVGRTHIKIKDLLNLSKDSVINLNKNAGDPVDIIANGKLISKGVIVSVNGKYCVKLTSIPEIKQD